jgi:hypothetical protein
MILWHLAYDEQPYYIPPKVYVSPAEADIIAHCRIRQGTLMSSESKLITVSFNRVLVNSRGYGEHAIERIIDAQTGNLLFDWRVTQLFDRIVENWSELKAALMRIMEDCSSLVEIKHTGTSTTDQEREEARTENTQDGACHDTMQERIKCVSWEETTAAAAETPPDVHHDVHDTGMSEASDDSAVHALTDGRREESSNEDSHSCIDHHDGDEQEPGIVTTNDSNQVQTDSERQEQDDSGVQASTGVESEKAEKTRHLSIETSNRDDTSGESEPEEGLQTLGSHEATKKSAKHNTHMTEPTSAHRKSPALTPITRERFWDMLRECDSLKNMSET